MSQRYLTYSNVLCCLALIASMSSCNVDPDYSRQLQIIDSLTTVLNTTSDEYRSVIASADTTWSDSVITHLAFIQDNYRGIMKKDMAEALRSYRNIPKALPVIYKNDLEINHEISFSKNQLSELKQSLTKKATHDAAGNPINELYVQTAIDNEENSLIRLKELMKQNRDLHVSVNGRYLDLYPTIKNWVDSIPEKKKTK